MSQESVNYQCPACMAPLAFSAQTGLLQCAACGNAYNPAEIEQYYASRQRAADDAARAASARAEAGQRSAFDQVGDEAAGASSVLTQEAVAAAAEHSAQAENSIDAYLSRASWNEEERAGMRSYGCSSCGAQLVVDATTAISECPYCGNQAMAPGVLIDGARPDYVIPFGLDKQTAESALTNYYRGKKFLPSEFAAANRIAHVQGVYVPFWLYDGRVEGAGTFTAKNISSWSEGDYQVTRIDVYRVWRAGNSSFTRLPADGSAKMPDGHMDAIEPFDYSGLQPFSTAYLPGFSAERYDMDAAACAERAHGRMQKTLAEQLRRTVTGYTVVEPGDVSSTSNIDGVAQALLPVWMLHTRWNDEDYLFAMNGQTGKFVGDLPVAPLKVVLWFAGLFLATLAVCLGLDYAAIHFKGAVDQLLFDIGVPLGVSGGLCWYFYRQMKTAREKDTAFDYVDGGGVNLTGSGEAFVTTYTNRVRINRAGNDE